MTETIIAFLIPLAIWWFSVVLSRKLRVKIIPMRDVQQVIYIIEGENKIKEVYTLHLN